MTEPFKCRATRVLDGYKGVSMEIQLRDLHMEVDRLHGHISTLLCHMYEMTPKKLNIDAFMFDNSERQFEALEQYLRSRLSINGRTAFSTEGEEYSWVANFYSTDTDPFEYCRLYTLYDCMHKSPFTLTGHQLDHETNGSQTLKIWFTK